MLDRKIAPPLILPEKLHLPEVTKSVFGNGFKCYSLNGGTEDLVKLELSFGAGRRYQPKPLVAAATCNLLLEGTKSKSALELASAVEFYGAYLETEFGEDSTSIHLFTLPRHLPNLLPLISEVLTGANFPEEELELYRKNDKQELEINLQRVEKLAKRTFLEIIFSSKGYGRLSYPSDFDALHREEILEFFNSHYTPQNGKIFITGNVTDDLLKMVEKHLGNIPAGNAPIEGEFSEMANFSRPKKIFQPKEGAVQSAISIGKIAPGIKHPDNFQFRFLNTILGGYFGSRLMNNIREDKGYTYGIHSSVVHLARASYMNISTQVGADVAKSALEEIYKEIVVLSNEKVNPDEIDLVRNYLTGLIIKSLDGPFSIMAAFKNLEQHGLDLEYYNLYLAALHQINGESLIPLAQKYFNPDHMVEVVAGRI